MMSPLKFYLITNEPGLAQVADNAGVDRIMVDLEVLGKAERQRGRNTLISAHSLDDISRVGAVLRRAELVTRVNPLFEGSRDEVEAALDGGTKRLMLPMFRSAHDLERFVRIVDGRALITGLLETVGAWEEVEAVARVAGVDDIHVGLTDLHLEKGFHFLFRCVAEGMVDRVAAACKSAGRKFGFGGIGRIGGGDLPARLIVAEHMRLGSQAVILGRAFHNNSKTLEELQQAGINLSDEVQKVVHVAQELKNRNLAAIERDRAEFQMIALSLDKQLADRAK